MTDRVKRNWCKICLCVMIPIWIWSVFPDFAAAEEIKDGELYANSACLMDADSGRVLYGKNPDAPMPMASTTKIMTCILALEQGDLSATVTASGRAASQPKVHLGVREGQQFLLEDLLYSLMLESHNDAAVMVAESVAGSVEEFAARMNEKAGEIGCTDTHFVTPNGLDETDEGGDHHTTAADLARIMRYCIRESQKAEDFLTITRTISYTFWDLEKSQLYQCSNHNAFLSMMDGALSGKTGFTARAGYCYVGALLREERCFIVSLLACGWPNNKSYKWSDTKKLMSYALNTYFYRDVLEHTWHADPIPVKNGQYEGRLGEGEAQVSLVSPVMDDKRELTLLLRDDEEPQVTMAVSEQLTAPVKKGDKTGKITYSMNGTVLAEYPVYAASDVEAIDFPWCLSMIWKRYCCRAG